ncbi:zinc-binding CMP/dCMP deaminase protein [Phascolomyces articulosus]|uniref:Zinc-binding CMP/dCMP deaminase protein n=1 Tax=Phascolomyces articulosus TaxID=60185 RepID=A0AAD5PGF8_9FUNG|nr:zinc-binding CMP/dCMP deaminase protein [Phascolomyces articulosus]
MSTTPAPASHEKMLEYLRECIQVAKRARSMDYHPFGSILVEDATGKVLLQHGNFGPVFHAESELARVAALNFKPEFLRKCTLYTSVEPCVMCSGACYWANIGTIVYAMPGAELEPLTKDSKECPKMELTCREVFSRGSRKANVIGPFPELYDEVLADHYGYWENH